MLWSRAGYDYSVWMLLYIKPVLENEVIFYDTHSLDGWFNWCELGSRSQQQQTGRAWRKAKREVRNRQKKVINDSIKFLLLLLHKSHSLIPLITYREWEIFSWLLRVLKLLFPHHNFDTLLFKMASLWFISRILLDFFFHFILQLRQNSNSKKNVFPNFQIARSEW